MWTTVSLVSWIEQTRKEDERGRRRSASARARARERDRSRSRSRVTRRASALFCRAADSRRLRDGKRDTYGVRRDPRRQRNRPPGARARARGHRTHFPEKLRRVDAGKSASPRPVVDRVDTSKRILAPLSRIDRRRMPHGLGGQEEEVEEVKTKRIDICQIWRI